MRRTTISLDDELSTAVEREARRLDLSISEVIRRALTAHLGFDPNGGRRPIPFAGIGRSGSGDIAANAEEILAREWSHDRDR